MKMMGSEVMAVTAPTSRWKTVSRRDPDFLAHLDGSFSSTHIALPVRSLNVGTAQEEVTFEIVPTSQISRPSLANVVWQLTRPESLALSLGPMLAVLFHALAYGQTILWPIAVSSFVGVLLFHLSMNLFNDYGDHIKGQDRLSLRGGGRALQKGWVRASSLRRTAWALGGMAAVFGLPAVLTHRAPLAIVAGFTLLAGLEIAFQKLRLKTRGWAEIIAFLLMGPLLTAGFSWAIAGEVSLSEAAMGCIFGSIALMYFHSVNFENIMVDSQAGVRTWATRAGFDSSKKFYYFTALLVLASSLGSVIWLERELRYIPVILAQATFLLPVCLKVKDLKSPLASGLRGLRGRAVELSWITTLTLIAGSLWILANRG